MSWLEDLQPASFRGVAFKVEGHEQSGGRRLDIKEYPGRDEPYPEDLGRKYRRFVVEAFLVGDDYLRRAEELTRALEESGPGTLVHPFLGEVQVAVEDWRRVESRRAGGRSVGFSLNCVEAGINQNPTGQADTRRGVTAAGGGARGVLSGALPEIFRTAGWPGWISGEAGALLGEIAETLERGAEGLRPRSAEAAAAFADALDSLRAPSEELLRAPADLAAALQSGLSGLAALSADTAGTMTGLRRLANRPAPPPPSGATPSRLRAAGNRQALEATARRLAVVALAETATEVELESTQAAIALRDELAERLDAEILAAGEALSAPLLAETAGAADLGTDPGTDPSDRIVTALTDLKAAMVRDLTQRGATLKPIVLRRLPASLPALVLAYDLYDDAGRDAEIVARNRVAHPGYLPAETPLEVLAP